MPLTPNLASHSRAPPKKVEQEDQGEASRHGRTPKDFRVEGHFNKGRSPTPEQDQKPILRIWQRQPNPN